MPRRKETPAPFIRICKQRNEGDCGIACLAMFLGIPYETVLVTHGVANLAAVGMTPTAIMETAAKLDHPLHLRRGFNLDDDTGILGVVSKQWVFEHVVVLHEGMVVDTDGTLWEVDDYLKAHKAKAVSLLSREGDPA